MSNTRKSKRQISITEYLVDHGLTENRTTAFALILGGAVYINNEKVSSTRYRVSEDNRVEVIRKSSFVSRGGEKLKSALSFFSLHVSGKQCLDVGASTGGFTDCLLKHGASRVYAVDVAYGKLDWKLRNDLRVINLEKHNIRAVEDKILRQSIDIAVCDVSFSSLKGILPVIVPYIKKQGYILSMVKPQFEVSPRKLTLGIVHNSKDQMDAVRSVKECGERYGLVVKGITKSAIKGAKGNQEYFILWVVQ